MTGPLSPLPGGRVQLIAPANFTSGGPELTHQLGRILLNLGVEATIVYVGSVRNEAGKFEARLQPGGCPKPYEKYQIPEASAFRDDERDVVVLPQTWIAGMGEFKKARIGSWWLGMAPGATFEQFFDAADPKKVHCYMHQSEYARRFLLAAGFESHRLADCLADRHFEPVKGGRRSNAVAFNPSKGMDRIVLLMERASKKRIPIDWLPIFGMTEEQVRTLLETVKVYADFGTHIGMDRIPREAAMAGAVVVTGMRGSAAYEEDVPVGDGFKFDDRQEGGVGWIERALDRIVDCLLDHEAEAKRQDIYREWILRQRETFVDEARRLFT